MDQNLTDDQEYQQRLFIRYAMVTFKLYFVAHLGIKAHQLRRVHQREPPSTQETTFMAGSASLSSSLGGEGRSLGHLQVLLLEILMNYYLVSCNGKIKLYPSPQPLAAQASYKPARYTPQQFQDNIEAMFELLPFRGRWQPIDNFVQVRNV